MNRSEWGLQLRISLVEAIAERGGRGCVTTWRDGFPEHLRYCSCCGSWFSVEDLEIDYPTGRTWYGRALNFLDRVRRQWREFDRGVRLRVLCKSCNSRDGVLRWRGRPRWKRAA